MIEIPASTNPAPAEQAPRKEENPSETKAKLECEKLSMEIALLRSPFKRNPAHWVSSFTALLAVGALVINLLYSKKEFVLATNQAVLAKIEMSKIEAERKTLREEVTRLDGEIAKNTARLKETENLLRAADTLLV